MNNRPTDKSVTEDNLELKVSAIEQQYEEEIAKLNYDRSPDFFELPTFELVPEAAPYQIAGNSSSFSSEPAGYSSSSSESTGYRYSFSEPAGYGSSFSGPAGYSSSFSEPAGYSSSFSGPAGYSSSFSGPADYSSSFSEPAGYGSSFSGPAGYSSSFSSESTGYTSSFSEPAGYSSSFSSESTGYTSSFSEPTGYRPSFHKCTCKTDSAASDLDREMQRFNSFHAELFPPLPSISPSHTMTNLQPVLPITGFYQPPAMVCHYNMASHPQSAPPAAEKRSRITPPEKQTHQVPPTKRAKTSEGTSTKRNSGTLNVANNPFSFTRNLAASSEMNQKKSYDKQIKEKMQELIRDHIIFTCKLKEDLNDKINSLEFEEMIIARQNFELKNEEQKKELIQRYREIETELNNLKDTLTDLNLNFGPYYQMLYEENINKPLKAFADELAASLLPSPANPS